MKGDRMHCLFCKNGCPRLGNGLQRIILPNTTCSDIFMLSSDTARNIGDKVIFSCDSSCRLAYSQNVTQCTPIGTWTLTPPFCTGALVRNTTDRVTPTTTVSPTPAFVVDNSLTQQDVIIIASTVGGVAAVVFLIILILLLVQRFCRREPNPEERRKMISRFGSPQSSFLSQDPRPRQGYFYDNSIDGMEFKERPLVPTRSMSFQGRREVTNVPNGYHDTQLQRAGSLDFGRLRNFDTRLPDDEIQQYYVATLPSGNRIPSYHVPRPIVGSRFEPLWNNNVQHI